MTVKRQDANRADKGHWKTRTRSVLGPESWARSCVLDPMHCGLLLGAGLQQLRKENCLHILRTNAKGRFEVVYNLEVVTSVGGNRESEAA